MANKAKLAKFNHKLYRQLAIVIHNKLCEDEACTYGRETAEMHERDQKLLRMHVRKHSDGGCRCWAELSCYNCQYSVDAENIAARVQFAKGSKVRA